MHVWSFIDNKLSERTPVVLLYVLHSLGSSPGRQGFKMAVAADNTFAGSIGGGIMEHKFVEMAKAIHNRRLAVPAMHRQVHDKNSTQDQSGMICSGEQTIFVYPVEKKDAAAINKLLLSLRQKLNGTLTLTPVGISFSEDMPEENFHLEIEGGQDFLLREKTGPKNILHIVGGGHCALALSRLMSTMDFHIHLYEERPGLNTMLQNDFVDEQHLLKSYAELSSRIDEGENVYVVIMTMGYRTDEVALHALLNKKTRYLGVLGSKNKMDKLYAAYEGAHALMHVKSPIGLPIKSQTPEEIAVSIAAEIIAEKNKDQ